VYKGGEAGWGRRRTVSAEERVWAGAGEAGTSEVAGASEGGGDGKAEGKPRLMTRATRTRERWDLLRRTLLEVGPRFCKIGRMLGMDKETVRAAWERGWPEKEWGKLPLREWYAKDMTALRAAQMAGMERAVQRIEASAPPGVRAAAKTGALAVAQTTPEGVAILQAVRILEEEERMLRLGRSNLSLLLAGVGELGPGILALQRRVGEKLRNSKGDESLLESVRMMRDLAQTMKGLSSAARDLVETGRMLKGQGGGGDVRPGDEGKVSTREMAIDIIRQALEETEQEAERIAVEVEAEVLAGGEGVSADEAAGEILAGEGMTDPSPAGVAAAGADGESDG